VGTIFLLFPGVDTQNFYISYYLLQPGTVFFRFLVSFVVVFSLRPIYNSTHAVAISLNLLNNN
jgi:hypothetical protein